MLVNVMWPGQSGDMKPGPGIPRDAVTGQLLEPAFRSSWTLQTDHQIRGGVEMGARAASLCANDASATGYLRKFKAWSD